MTELERVQLFEAAGLDRIVSREFKTYLMENGFFHAPASTKYHGAYEGGLFDHSLMVMNTLVDLSAKNGLKWRRVESPFIVGMFHDLCKIDQYRHPIKETLLYVGSEETTIYDEQAWEYNPNTRQGTWRQIGYSPVSAHDADRGGVHVYSLSHGGFHRQGALEELH